MPGPVSDSFDPEFGTSDDADAVSSALREVRDDITAILGAGLRNIVGVVRGPEGPALRLDAHERSLRLIRFAIDRALETI
jgi:hypothetical protein